MLLKAPSPQLYPNSAGELVAYERLTDDERRTLLARFGYAELLAQVVDMVHAGSLFGRMLFDELARLAEIDLGIAEQLTAAAPKRARGRPERWTLRARREFLIDYFQAWAEHDGTREALVANLGKRHGIFEIGTVEDLITDSLKRLKNERSLQILRTVCEKERARRTGSDSA